MSLVDAANKFAAMSLIEVIPDLVTQINSTNVSTRDTVHSRQ